MYGNLELGYHLVPFSLERDHGDKPMFLLMEAWGDSPWAQGKYDLSKKLCLGVETGVPPPQAAPPIFFSFGRDQGLGALIASLSCPRNVHHAEGGSSWVQRLHSLHVLRPEHRVSLQCGHVAIQTQFWGGSA